ncbi:MAG TPA: PHB depolymerase family esterase [Xanthobacteraceae bacterium]|nr:PHB depolymerase family esterase [Xanthobacteraceae bacterium]
MPATAFRYWTIGAALALVASAAAAEPMGEATRYVGTVGGRERTFVEYVPKTLKAGAPLLFVLHPSGGDAEGMREEFSNYEFDELADKQGFLVVYPDGVGNTWNDCRGGSPFPSKRLKIDDAGFIKSLIDVEVMSHAVDRKRVFAAGWSNGAQLAYRLALESPEDFAGVAAVSASVPVKESLDCGQVDRPIPVMIVNGTADPINPFRGGMVNLGGAELGNVLSSEDTAKYWAKLLGVTAPPQLGKLPHKGGPTSVDSMTWVKDGTPVVILYSIENGGHAMPLAGEDLDSPVAIWDFFAKLPSR